MPSNLPSAPGYKPLSALALVAFIIGVVYAAIMGALIILAFFQGKTLFLPLWVILFPALAALAAVAARAQIRRSEGTLSGSALATWAWWLSLLFGFGFLAFYLGTYVAVGQQAQSFTDQWLNKLKEGELVDAFVLTQEPAQRKFDNPRDTEAIMQRYGIMPKYGTKGPLAVFADRDIAQIFTQGGSGTHFRSLGAKNWDYDKGGYKVWQTYAIASPLGAWEVQVPVRSSESPEFEGRQWHVDFRDVTVTASLITQMGVMIDVWRETSRAFVKSWLAKLAADDLEGAYLDTCEPTKRKQQEQNLRLCRAANRLQALAANLVAAGSGCATALSAASISVSLNPELECRGYLQGCQDFLSGKLVDPEKLLVLNKYREDVTRGVIAEFADPSSMDIMLQDSTPHFTPGEHNDLGQVELKHDVRLQLFPKEERDQDNPKYVVDATIVVQSDQGAYEPQRQPKWRVLSFKLRQANVPAAETKGPPGSPKPKSGRVRGVPPGK